MTRPYASWSLHVELQMDKPILSTYLTEMQVNQRQLQPEKYNAQCHQLEKEDLDQKQKGSLGHKLQITWKYKAKELKQKNMDLVHNHIDSKHICVDFNHKLKHF